ncbi:MAG: leucine-rich repeat domain-containing protein [Promethearchaeota archaeon]
MQEFKVNEYITLKLENIRTNIYVNGVLFNQCKFLLLNIPIDEISTFDQIESIDEAAEKLDKSMEGRGGFKVGVDPKTEFWGHCSNMQVWAEHNYDTRILHRNIAFPLLKKLVDLGDPIAKRVFKEEIAKRFETYYPPVMLFLIEKKYLNYFEKEELESLFFSLNTKLRNELKREFGGGNALKNLSFSLFKMFIDLGVTDAKNIYKEEYFKMIEKGNLQEIEFLINRGYLNYFDKEELESLFLSLKAKLKNELKKGGEREQILRTFAFSLLKKLIDLGVPDAKNILNEEIFKVVKRGNLQEIEFLINKGYLNYFEKEEFKDLFFGLNATLKINIEKALKKENLKKKLVFPILEKFIELGYHEAKSLFKVEFGKINDYDRIFLRDLEAVTRVPVVKYFNSNYMPINCYIKDGYVLKLSFYENKDLKELPISIDTLSKLKYLSFYDCNSLTNLPKNLGNLKSLKYLSLNYCPKIVKVPENIGNLSNLIELEFNNCNGLTTLPESIGSLPKLEKLDLRGTRTLKWLPKKICVNKNYKILPEEARKLSSN